MKTYAFSGWIANLGVDPLFSFACFLLAPAFFLFNFLLILVCVVFEDIVISLLKNNINFRVIFLSLSILLVKVLLPSNTTFAAPRQDSENIFLAKGEQIELSVGNFESFSIGNKEIIAHKLMKNKKKMLIKGKMIGFTDFIINQKPVKTYHIYVTSKKEQLRKMEIAHAVARTGLTLKATEKLLYITGEVKDLESYLILKKLKQSDGNFLQLNVKLESKFKNELIANIYEEFYKEGGELIDCTNKGIEINCFYSSNIYLELFKQYYSQKYRLKLIPQIQKIKNHNFEISCTIVAKESIIKRNSNSGFNHLGFDLQTAIDNGTAQLETGTFLFQDGETEIKVLAKPMITTLLGEDFNIELGTQIPYQFTRDQTTVTEWNFAGLKLNGLLSLHEGRMRIKYHSELTQGNQDGISGPQNKATVNLPLNKSIKVLSIKARDIMHMNNGVPWLHKVPILKFFFTESSFQDSQKEIAIFIKVKRKDF